MAGPILSYRWVGGFSDGFELVRYFVGVLGKKHDVEKDVTRWLPPGFDTHSPAAMALLAAFLFGLNAPLSKLLLAVISPLYMVAFLYLGAGLGMMVLDRLFRKGRSEAPLSRQELPWTLAMVLLDVLAPLLLMWGLRLTTAANASLLFNFEVVATSVIALVFFHEAIGKRTWLSLLVITVASLLLSIDFRDASAWEFSLGSLYVLAACGCWGLENNCTRSMSAKSPAQIVMVKGIGSGMTALVLALLLGNPLPTSVTAVALSCLLGFVAYGLSIFFYVKAQRDLGAARTSAYYAAAPFMGVLLSMLILRELPSWHFVLAALFMLGGVWLSMWERHIHAHVHDLVTHNHAHLHDDEHHRHGHQPPVTGWHAHEHRHDAFSHAHGHAPDIHHRHQHG